MSAAPPSLLGALAQQRCALHELREAAGRCPECARYYCRECLTEHDGRVICSSCLAALLKKEDAATSTFGTSWIRPIIELSGLGLGLLAAWFYFYALGSFLTRYPAAFHEVSGWDVTQDKEPEQPAETLE
jgi:hypothetical protein